MGIDLILDRKDYPKREYDPSAFYEGIKRYDPVAYDVAEAMEKGTEDDVKRALCRYIVEYGYNLNLLTFILKNNWLTDKT